MYVAEQMKVGGTIERALVALAGQKSLLLAARQLAIDRGFTPPPAFNELLAQQDGLGVWAQEIIDREFHDVNVSTLISVWSAVEVAIEDTIVLMLARDTAKTKASLLGAGFTAASKLEGAVAEQTARRTYRALERWSREGLAAGPAAVALIRAAGLPIDVAESTASTLSELNGVRNCLLHRGGVADSQLVREAPGLKLAEGDVIRVSSALTQRYLAAVSDFAVALVRAAAAAFTPPKQG